MGYLVAILATEIGSTILRSYDIVQRSPDCRRARSRRIFVLILGQPAKTFAINSMGMSSKRSFRYLAISILLLSTPAAIRPLPFSLGKPKTRFPNLEESIQLHLLLPPRPDIEIQIRWGKSWVKIWGGISHGLREWPPEAFNQLANSTVLYPRNR